ncbi:MAG TPA: sulfate ABC transporter ATP-binding protein [Planctomycetota bacterium]|nr:sulfate ABC transporter ATP-binding protein [Planctomycetota bacterium]
MSIRVRNITRRFGSFTALNDISLDIADGELVALLGPSGSGKTTLLRIIAGLDVPDLGTVELAGEDATGRPPQTRGVGFVFQHYALFRHMTVRDNIAFPLSVKPRHERPTKAAQHERAMELLRLVQLEGYAGRRPHQLSGGQRQRVALARALAVEPKVLLLDEPFGALDAQVRKELRRWLRRLHDEVHVTSVFVTHDQEEAMEVADRVVVFNQGRIEQVGTPEEVYQRPASPFVHRFLGDANEFKAHRDATSSWVRPHDVRIARYQVDGSVPATVRWVKAVGPVVRVELSRGPDHGPVEAEIPYERQADLRLVAGDKVFVGFDSVRAFSYDGGAGI